MKLRWTTKTPTDGWWFQRWKSRPKHWFIVEIGWGQIMEAGLTTRKITRMTIEQEQLIRFLAGPLMNGSLTTYPVKEDSLYQECLKLERAGLLEAKSFQYGESVVFQLVGYDH